jgi:pilus assembly protein CpaE
MSNSTQNPVTLQGSDWSVAVVGPDEKRREEVAAALYACQCAEVREIAFYPFGPTGLQKLLQQQYDVVLLDLDSDPDNALSMVESAASTYAAVVMVYSERSNVDLMLRCIRAGAREYLTLPLAKGTIVEALNRVAALRPAKRTVQKTDGRLLVFIGSKGGAGTTTMICNSAVSLALETGQKVLLIDLNLPLGDAAICLGVTPKYSTVNALENVSRLDARMLSSMTVRHKSGLSVLAAPGELVPSNLTSRAVNRLLTLACREFDYVLIDTEFSFELEDSGLFSESSTVFLVTQIGVPELRNANRLINRLSEKGGPRLEIVVNRYNSNSQPITEDNVMKALTRAPQWKIPENYAEVVRAQFTSTPLAFGTTALSRAIAAMVQSVCKEPITTEKKKGPLSFFR